jgi:DNA-binding CsgD family transcriptional regulator
VALLERSAELGLIERGLQLARGGRGRLLVLEGPAGIGKTSLMAAADERARALGMCSLRARAGQLERDFAFGVVRQLFEPVVVGADAERRARLMSGAAALSAALFEFERAPEAVGADPSHGTLHGLFWLTANLAEDEPLVLTVDDLHWCDAPSLRFLAYLGRRLEGLAVLLLAGTRPSEPGAASALLDELRTDPAAGLVRPASLSAAAVDALLRAALAVDVDREFSDAIHDWTGGNPLFVHELVRVVRARGIPPTPAGARHVRELAPETVARFVGRRLESLGATAGALAASVAILGEPADLTRAAELAGLGQHEAERAARSLRRIDVLRAGEPLAFVHPLVRSAVYEGLDPSERDAKHRQAARLHAGAGAPIERVASHLLATRPAGDGALVAPLRAAARHAMATGAPDVAAAYLGRALAEPPDATERAAVLLELGTAEARGRPNEALAHLDEALQLTHDDAALGDAAVELALALQVLGRMVDSVETLERAVERIKAPGVARRLEVELIWLASYHPDTHQRGQAHLARRRDDDAGDLVGLELVGLRASARAHAGHEPAEALAGARGALAGGVLLRDHHAPAFTVPVTVLVLLDRFDEALDVLADALDRARRTGAAYLFTMTSMLRADVWWRLGELDEAEADAHNEITHGGVFGRAFALNRCLADVLIERGRLDQAADALAEAEAHGESPRTLPWALFRSTRGRLRILHGRVEEGVEDLLTAGQWLQALGWRNPALAAWRSHAALGLARLKRDAQATELAREEVALARRWGAPRALGQALTAAGLLARGEPGVELLREAAGVLAGSPALLMRARALTELGAALRRGNRRADAREPLAAGLELAERCGASALAERAREELIATGARPRRAMRTGVDALTPGERRVASLAAGGQTNRDIAQALFVTEKTIETHLSHAYRKLDIHSRSQLTSALAARPPD